MHVGWHDDHDCSGALGESCFLATPFKLSLAPRAPLPLRAVWGSPHRIVAGPQRGERLTLRG